MITKMKQNEKYDITMTQDIKDLTPFVGMGESPATKDITTEMMIIGVGGGGGNAVRYMYNTRNIEGIRYVVCKYFLPVFIFPFSSHMISQSKSFLF